MQEVLIERRRSKRAGRSRKRLIHFRIDSQSERPGSAIYSSIKDPHALILNNSTMLTISGFLLEAVYFVVL
jgi:hypothetical protein